MISLTDGAPLCLSSKPSSTCKVNPISCDRRAYGVICTENGRLKEIRLRPWPKIISAAEISLLGNRFHNRATGDCCWLYYNQPR